MSSLEKNKYMFPAVVLMISSRSVALIGLTVLLLAMFVSCSNSVVCMELKIE